MTTSRSTSARPTPGGYGYTVFGKVVSGMDVVEKIGQDGYRCRRPVPQRDVPTKKVMITKAFVVDGK